MVVFAKVFQSFLVESPVSVMFRGALENIFSADRLDRLFTATAVKQYSGELLFSTCAELLSLVVLKARKSLHASYLAKREEIAVSIKAVYDKVAGVETAVSEQLVRETAADLAIVVDELGSACRSPLPGFEVRILDGNHLAGTDHRILETRRLGAAVLPGQTLCVLDPQRQLVLDEIACEDGHANERALIPRLLERVQPGQCWIADSAFCTLDFLFGVSQRQAYFLLRQHGQLRGELQGQRRKIGRCSTGLVYEQELLVRRATGAHLTLRRLTVVRDQPTSRGDHEVHLLTNLPSRIKAHRAAEAYLDRWGIEQCFQDLTTSLRCELNTLGYPKAALFGFSLAVVMFNIVSATKAALRAGAKGTTEQKQRLSMYYLADEIAGVSRGMAIAIPAAHWERAFATLTPRELAAKLKWLARRADLSGFQTNPWTKKKPQPKRRSGHRGNHVSTFELLLTRRRPSKPRLKTQP
jgi:hypothetical protein